MTYKLDERRVRSRNDTPVKSGTVVYWMQRDQRVRHNWALLYALASARACDSSVVVIFNLVPTFGVTTLRHYDFMFRGLQEVEEELRSLNIPFVLLQGQPTETVPRFCEEYEMGHVVTDFNPLRFTDEWRSVVAKKLSVRLSEVDAHNTVPAWWVSDKAEFAAYTFRPKVKRALKEFLTPFPTVSGQIGHIPLERSAVDWKNVLASVQTDRSVLPVDWLTPGTQAGYSVAHEFLKNKLSAYDTTRNDPNADGQSNLSPYLHFGQISAQEVVRNALSQRGGNRDAKEAFVEELVVRRELTDNFCLYTNQYDTIAGAHAWAQKTIADHANDAREYVYTVQQFEAAQTHDELWNAMQLQMVREGKMHGWCRMYWAKKILEWTPDVQTAIDTALYLNDKYELDGTDPNGIVGVMWSICGVHDRAWTERPVFGKVRYMNYAGAKRKFDVSAYTQRYQQPSLK